MTKNQIEYWTLAEAVKHNRITEAQQVAQLSETSKHNRADEQIRSRANSINDAHYMRQDLENRWHNRVTESQTDVDLRRKQSELEETIKSHRNSEAINAASVAVDSRNADTNARNAATNERNAAINAMNAATNARNAEINAQNAGTNRYNAETQRQEVLGQLDRWYHQNRTETINWDKIQAEINKLDSETARNQMSTRMTELEADYQEYVNGHQSIDWFVDKWQSFAELYIKYTGNNTQAINGILRAFGGVFSLWAKLLGMEV